MFVFGIIICLCAAEPVTKNEKLFVEWMRQYDLTFNGEEYLSRFGVWMVNYNKILEQNKRSSSYTTGLNQFSAMTPSEYKSLLNTKIHSRSHLASQLTSQKDVKLDSNIESFDWREKGVLNPIIEDKKGCTSDWAFAAAVSCESVNSISSGKFVAFSVQSFLDCSTLDQGCTGGFVDLAYEYVIEKQNGQFNLASEYPYTGQQGTCQFAKKTKVGKITKWEFVMVGSENDLQNKLLKFGPCSCAVDASKYSFTSYSGGIYDEPECRYNNYDLNVVCVGFGVGTAAEKKAPFWIIRNCFGERWGEKGYMRMIRKNNQCGIASLANVPVV